MREPQTRFHIENSIWLKLEFMPFHYSWLYYSRGLLLYWPKFTYWNSVVFYYYQKLTLQISRSPSLICYHNKQVAVVMPENRHPETVIVVYPVFQPSHALLLLCYIDCVNIFIFNLNTNIVSWTLTALSSKIHLYIFSFQIILFWAKLKRNNEFKYLPPPIWYLC